MQRSHFLKYSLLALLLPCLLGCKQPELTRLSLFQNSDFRQKKLTACEMQQTPECDMVKNVAQEYMVLNSQREENPEQFGKMILQAQEQLGKLKSEWEQEAKQLAAHPSDTLLQTKVISLKQDYTAQLDRVKIFLAIVATTSPE